MASINGPESTVIMGQGPMGYQAIRCVCLGPGVHLVGFTLTNGVTGFTGDMFRDKSGGGAFSSVVTDSSIISNNAYQGGGVGESVVTNCIIRGNIARYGRGGAYTGCRLLNCILYDNIAPLDPNLYNPASVNFTCITPWHSGDGNITDPPLFVDSTRTNYHLPTPHNVTICISSGVGYLTLFVCTGLCLGVFMYMVVVT